MHHRDEPKWQHLCKKCRIGQTYSTYIELSVEALNRVRTTILPYGCLENIVGAVRHHFKNGSHTTSIEDRIVFE